MTDRPLNQIWVPSLEFKFQKWALLLFLFHFHVLQLLPRFYTHSPPWVENNLPNKSIHIDIFSHADSFSFLCLFFFFFSCWVCLSVARLIFGAASSQLYSDSDSTLLWSAVSCLRPVCERDKLREMVTISVRECWAHACVGQCTLINDLVCSLLTC